MKHEFPCNDLQLTEQFQEDTSRPERYEDERLNIYTQQPLFTYGDRAVKCDDFSKNGRKKKGASEMTR